MTELFAAVPARLRLAGLADPAGDDRAAGPVVVEGLAVPWNTTVQLNLWGDTVEFAPGAFTVTDPARVKFAGDHRTGGRFGPGPLVFGYGVEFTDTPEGLAVRFEIPRDELDDPEVARIVRQMGNGVRDALSIGADIVEADETVIGRDMWGNLLHHRVTAAQLLEVSSVVLPRFDDARHTPVAAHRDTDGRPRFRLHATRPDPVTLEDPAMPTTVTADTDTDTDRLAAHTQVVAATMASAPIPVVHPLARFASLGEYALARYTDPTLPTLQAAWVDQTTPNNPGVIPPVWLTEVRGIVDLGRPFITALGGARSAGEAGMSVDWPYFDGDLYALIGEQAAQKTEITSVRVDIKRANAALKTWAGGSDVALQLIERSDPAYLGTYLRIMSAAFAAVTDRAAARGAHTASTEEVVVDLATADAEAVAAALFNASLKVQLATGTPAGVVAVATDVFPKVAAAVMQLAAPTANTAQGAADASNLRVALAGLSVTHVPGLAAGTAVVTNGEAFGWVEDGPRTIDALDVPKLGRDVAVYAYATPAAFVPAGIVKLVAVATP